VTWVITTCSATGFELPKVAGVVQIPFDPTGAGVVPGSAAPPASRMLTIEPGTPVPVKVTLREATPALLAGEVTAKG
jgi:hypothetical protein